MRRIMIALFFSQIFLTGLASAAETPFQATLRGEDSVSGEPCFLYVLESGFEVGLASSYYAKVVTSYVHHDDDEPAVAHEHEGAPEPLLVKISKDKPATLTGATEDGDQQISISLSGSNVDVRQASSFFLKQAHEDHFDSFRCRNMSLQNN